MSALKEPESEKQIPRKSVRGAKSAPRAKDAFGMTAHAKRDSSLRGRERPGEEGRGHFTQNDIRKISN